MLASFLSRYLRLCLSLPEAKLKSLQLIVLAEETSKQFTADFVVWLLVIILMHIYNAKSKQSKWGGLGPGKELNPVINKLKKSLLLNRIKEIETTGQDPTQLRTPKLPTCEKELKDSLEPGVVMSIFNTTPGGKDRWIHV